MILLFKVIKTGAADILPPVEIDKSISLKKDIGNQDTLNEEHFNFIKKELKKIQNIQNEIIEKAHIEAENILEEAHMKASQIEKEAEKNGYDVGFKKGFEEGIKKGNFETNKIIDEAKKIKEVILIERSKLYDEYESDMVQIIIDCVEKLIDINMEDNNDLIINLIKKGMENYEASDKVIVRVCEKDYDYCIKNKEKIIKNIKFVDDINFVKDLSLKKGDCVINTPYGMINSGVLVQINTLKEILEGVLNEQ